MFSVLEKVACNPFTFLGWTVHLGLPLADLQLNWRELHTILDEQLPDLVTLGFETVTETSGVQMIVRQNKWVNVSTVCVKARQETTWVFVYLTFFPLGLGTSTPGSPQLEDLSWCLLWSTISSHPYISHVNSARRHKILCMVANEFVPMYDRRHYINPRFLKYVLSLISLLVPGVGFTPDDGVDTAASRRPADSIRAVKAVSSSTCFCSSSVIRGESCLDWASWKNSFSGVETIVGAADKDEWAFPREKVGLSPAPMGSVTGNVSSRSASPATKCPSACAITGAPGQGGREGYRSTKV